MIITIEKNESVPDSAFVVTCGHDKLFLDTIEEAIQTVASFMNNDTDIRIEVNVFIHGK